MSNPSLEHLKYLNNIFSYLNKTKDLGLDLTLKSIKQSKPNPNSSFNYSLEDKSSSINLLGVSDSD
jgi:hypothetical protein